MIINLHDIVSLGAQQFSAKTALKFKKESISYTELADQVSTAANRFLRAGLNRHQRLAVFLPKQFETVTSFFATSRCGGVFCAGKSSFKAIASATHFTRL